MTASVFDDFGGAGSLNGTTTDTGGLTWTADTGLQMSGGRVVNNGAQYTAIATVSPVGSTGEDLDVKLTNLTVDTGYAGGLQFAISGGSLYQVNLNQSGLTVVLYRNGVQLLSATVPSVTGVDLSARLRLNDLGEGVVTVAVAGVDRLIYTDVSPLTGRGCGFFIQQLGTNSADSFTATATTPATMTTARDSFNRANGAPGAPWVQGGNGTAVAEITSNTLGNAGPYGNTFSGQQPTVKQRIGVGDLDISAKVAAVPNSDDMGITFRAGTLYSDGATWFAAVADNGFGNPAVLLYSPAVGSPGSGGTIPAGGILRVTVIGDVVTVYADGVYRDSRTEANGRNNSYAGLYFEFNNSSGRLDDFSATVIPRVAGGWNVGRISWS